MALSYESAIMRNSSWYMRDPMLEFLMQEDKEAKRGIKKKLLLVVDWVMAMVDLSLSLGWFNMDIVAVRKKKV